MLFDTWISCQMQTPENTVIIIGIYQINTSWCDFFLYMKQIFFRKKNRYRLQQIFAYVKWMGYWLLKCIEFERGNFFFAFKTIKIDSIKISIWRRAMLNSRSGKSRQISSTDGCVSFSLNDSWTGKKLFEVINQDHNLYATSKDLHVRKMTKCLWKRVHTKY